MQDVRLVLLYGSTFPYRGVVGEWLKKDVLRASGGRDPRGLGDVDRALTYAADLVPAVDGVGRLPVGWLAGVCPQFGDEPAGGQAALPPGRRHRH